jgi:hypothetical protein
VAITDMHVVMLAVFYKALNPLLRENSNNPPSGNQRLNIEDIQAAAALSQQGCYMPLWISWHLVTPSAVMQRCLIFSLKASVISDWEGSVSPPG